MESGPLETRLLFVMTIILVEQLSCTFEQILRNVSIRIKKDFFQLSFDPYGHTQLFAISKPITTFFFSLVIRGFSYYLSGN